jgi:hypothetical protein
MKRKYTPTPLSLPFEDSPSNQEESDKYANALLHEGHYPAGLGGCFTVGISGGCGLKCFVYRQGDCELPDEAYEAHYAEMTDEELEAHLQMYPDSYYGSGKLKLKVRPANRDGKEEEKGDETL